MKPSEFMKNFQICIEQDYDYIKNCEIIDLRNNQSILSVENPIGNLEKLKLENCNWRELDERFIDREELINLKIGTCLGLEIFKIQKMIDFFRKEGYNPNGWEEFEKGLNRRRLK